ncbi:trehalose-phosphatase [uncultured Jannaschia sp.]|uniref:trehalose-phosphatase n=1 Tax=uncultured Jannaschia sp. TaxID=293347 RepID=UPI0026339FD4|nr:trehalose-phosphatase [uncultured Jannaschia sp.]
MQYYQMTGFLGGPDPCTQKADDIDLPHPDTAALLLDFDGTLVDIADRPDGITVPDDLADLLARAMDRTNGAVALVSGRTIDDLVDFLPGFDGTLIGAHGSEFRVAGERFPAADYDHDTIERLQRLVEDFGALRPEFLVEPKPTGVVLHYRQAEALGALALHFMESLADAAEGFRLQPALMAYEIKPDSVGKDIALDRLLGDGPFAGRTPIYAGDDLTDEPALELVRARGGAAIKIGDAETVAAHRLADPTALRALLDGWLG